MADSSGMGIYYADREPALLDRDYLEQYERTYDTSGPSLGGGFQLFSLFADGEASPVVKTLGNSYTQAAPSLTDDGGYLFYLDDLNDSGDATKVRAAVMTRNGTGYDSETPVIFDDGENAGYGDSGLNASGSGENVAAVWSRVMAEPAITEPGQTVTSDIQADMMNNSHVFVAVRDGNDWSVTDLTKDFAGGNLAPVVARKGDHILVAWRQVTSTTADVTDFNARDYIYCAVSNDGGKTWTKPTPIYNGTSGTVKGLETAMLPSGAAAVAFTLQGEDHDIVEGIYDQNAAYAVIDLKQLETEGYDPRYVVMAGDDLAENPQLATVKLDNETGEVFVLGWHSLSAEDGLSDIRLTAVDGKGNRVTGFVDSLNSLIENTGVTVSANFQFVQNADSLDDLSILWSDTAGADVPEEDAAAQAASDVIYGLRFRTVTENGVSKVSVTAAQPIIAMNQWTTVDSFSAYVDGETIYTVSQGTYYDNEKTDSVTVTVYNPNTGREDEKTVSIAKEKTSIYTAAGVYTDTIRVDSILPDYANIRKGSSVPVQISVTNLGTEPVDQVNVAIDDQTTTFGEEDDAFVPIAPGQVRTLTAYYTVPADEAISNPEYTISGRFGNKGTDTTEPATLALNVPDLGIADADILRAAENGDRVLQFTLFNASDAELANSGRTVKLGIYSDAECTEPINSSYFTLIDTYADEDGALLTVDDADLAKVDEGSYTVQYRFDLEGYIQQELDGKTPFADENGEVRDGGVTLYAKAWVEGEGGELVEYVTSNNSASIKLESLLKQADGQHVTITSQLSQSETDGGSTVEVTLRNNSIVNSQNGNVIVTLLDGDGNVLEQQQSYTGSGTDNGLVALDPEARTTLPVFQFTQTGASAVVTYSDLILEGASAALDSLTFTNLPGVSLEDFEADSDDPNTFRATIVADRVPSTGVLASAESATAQISLAGGPQNSGNALSGTVALTPGGRDTITITVIDGSETKTYILTVRNDGGASSGGGSSPSYAVETPEDVAHGTVTVRPSRAERGETVTITATPDEGYAVGSVTVTQTDGTSVPVTQKGAGTYTFTMPRGKVEVGVTFVPEDEAGLPFLDVAEGSWYYDAVSYVYEHGLMTGTSGTAFAPDANLTRAMMATVLWAMEGSPVVNYAMTYTDVSGGAWYAEAVRWATSEGVVSGVGDNRFDPDAPITREQMAVMLYAYARTQGYGVSGRADLSRYADAAAIGSWAETALEWAVAEGLISGTSDTTLSPQGQATRAQVATILRNFHQSFGSD